MVVRRIVGLRWAKPSPEGPGFGPSRARGAKRQGILYEEEVWRSLPGGKRGLWWQFEDTNGPGWCQTDILLLGASRLLLLECKYSSTEEAWRQIEGLYLPILGKIYSKPVVGLQVVKKLSQGLEDVEIYPDLRSALAGSARRRLVHWKGLTPLLGQKTTNEQVCHRVGA